MHGATWSVGNIHGILGRADLPSAHATARMKSLSRQNTGPWGGLRLRGVGPAQPAAALRQRMWRSRTELDRALDPDGLGRQVGEEVSGAGWRGPV